MSRAGAIFGLMGRLPTVFRTLVHLRPDQARAQLMHGLTGTSAPLRYSGGMPDLAIVGPRTAYLPPPGHVRAGDAETAELLSTPFDLAGGIDWKANRNGPLFAYHLHQHEYLRLGVFSPEQRAAHLKSWIECVSDGIGWDPHPISLRLLCWGKLLTTPGLLEADDPIRDAMLHSMCDQAETLADRIEIRYAEDDLGDVFEKYGERIAGETLAVKVEIHAGDRLSIHKAS